MTGEELQRLREDAGITRTELAQKMGLPGRTPQRQNERIYDLESGRRNILSHTEVLIRKILKKETGEAPV
jgi:transcriptional regulator with XRE-family HTH domain